MTGTPLMRRSKNCNSSIEAGCAQCKSSRINSSGRGLARSAMQRKSDSSSRMRSLSASRRAMAGSGTRAEISGKSVATQASAMLGRSEATSGSAERSASTTLS